MCADAGLHPDETRRHRGEPGCHLATRPLLAQDDRATPIDTHDVKRVLTDVDTNHGDSIIEVPRLRRPLPASPAGGAGAQPDHPISGHRPVRNPAVQQSPAVSYGVLSFGRAGVRAPT